MSVRETSAAIARPERLSHEARAEAPRSRALPAAVFALAFALLALHAWRYLPFVSDDSLISLRYAQRLIDGHGLTWTDGERVEGYSNLLWVLASAALGLLGVGLVDALRVLGFAGMGTALAAVAWAYRPRDLASSPPSLVAAAALALSGPIAVWAVGGLEQAFVAGLLAWAMVLAYPLLEEDGRGRAWLPGVPLALLCLTRPDGPLFTATSAAAIVLARRVSARSMGAALRLAALPAAAFATQLLFRLAYYGDWVPNTARAKVAFSWTHFLGGLGYVGEGARWLAPLALLGAGSLLALRDGARRRRALLLALPLFAWLLYVAYVGGDIFPGRRHLVPAVVLLALLTAEWLSWSLERARGFRAGAAIVSALALAALGVSQWKDPANRRAMNERWEWDGLVIGKLLGEAFASARPLVAVDPAGCVPFFSGLPSLDMMGLNDAWLARNPPPDFGRGFIGHELGDGAYVLSREPDLAVFCLPAGSARPCFRSGREMVRTERWKREWRLVRFEGAEPHRLLARLWVRQENGRIGVVREGERIRVPGFLLATTDGAAARLDEGRRLGASIERARFGRVRLEVPAGRWRVETEASAEVAIEVRARGRLLARGAPPLAFDLEDARAPLELRVHAEAEAAHVLGLELSRLGGSASLP